MTETERALQEITECTNEIEILIAQKSVLEPQAQSKQVELKAINDGIAQLQSSLIKENQRMKELDIILNWLNQEGE